MEGTTSKGSDRHTVVLIHGFTQNARCWAPVDEALAEHHDVLAVDLPGHGTRSDVVADLPGTADLLAHEISEHLSERGTSGQPAPPAAPGTDAAGPPPAPGLTDKPGAVVIGYSLGGRVGLHLALAHPWLVDRLVLIGATPGIEDPDERADRRAADESRAALVKAVGVSEFLDGWLALPLFAGLDARSSHRGAREANTAEGLASSLLHCGTGTQEPLWDRLGELSMPTLAVSGSLDTKFCDIADRMVRSVGDNARHLVVPDVGHTVHLEDPDAFLEGLSAWSEASS